MTKIDGNQYIESTNQSINSIFTGGIKMSWFKE